MIPKSFYYLFNGEIFFIKAATPDDAPSVHQAVIESLDCLKKYCDWAHLPQSIEAHRRRLEVSITSLEVDPAFHYHIYLRSQLIGCFSLHRRFMEASMNWEIGYWVHSKYVGRGFGQLALDASTWIYSQSLEGNIYLRIHSSNLYSLRIAKKGCYLPLGRTLHKSPITSEEHEMHLFGTNKDPNSQLFSAQLFADFDCNQIPGRIQRWKTNLLEVQF
jgi:RimJ/RimL family protein N-acetyltransferase